MEGLPSIYKGVRANAHRSPYPLPLWGYPKGVRGESEGGVRVGMGLGIEELRAESCPRTVRGG